MGGTFSAEAVKIGSSGSATLSVSTGSDYDDDEEQGGND